MSPVTGNFVNQLLRLILLICLPLPVIAQYPGLPTRDQNPLIQGYLIPAVPLASIEGKWSFANALYLTNTYQKDENSSQLLVIDVENTRYDFQAAYALNHWNLGLTVSLIDNQAGHLDTLIEDWHDFFGLPQGGRDQVDNDRLQLLYQQNGEDIINSQNTSSGLADIQLSAQYQLRPGHHLWLVLELPSSESSEFISSQGTDLAAAYAFIHGADARLTQYGHIGISILDNKGLLQDKINEHIIFGQWGLRYRYNANFHWLVQADYHSSLLEDPAVDGLDHSLQAQFVLRLPRVLQQHQLEIFFSEDILPGHAPDITFAIRLSPHNF